MPTKYLHNTVCNDSVLLAPLLSAFGKWAKWGSEVLDD